MSNLKIDEYSVQGIGAIPSAATVDLENATGNLIDISGTTQITRIILYGGHERTVRFTGVLSLKNGSNLVLPGGDITTAVGDFAKFEGYDNGVVRCAFYQRAASLPQPALTGTYSLANFTDPGDATPSLAMGGQLGVLIFGYVVYTQSVDTGQGQTFAVETASASGVYTTVQVVSQTADALNAPATVSVPFSFFVPTGRKWKHTASGAATIGAISGIVL